MRITFCLFALVASAWAADKKNGGNGGGDFNAQLAKNLSTAAGKQEQLFGDARALIQGNTTDQFNDNNGGKGDDSVDQTSLTLADSQINIGSFNDGQFSIGSDAGQVGSITSQNNFVNFCASQSMHLHNGLQWRGEPACNPIPMGVFPSDSNIPTVTFTNPLTGDTVKAQTKLVLQFRMTFMDAGNFVNAQTNYAAAPQQVDQQSGNIIGHSHVTCSKIDSLQSDVNIEAHDFLFFQGINRVPQDGVFTATIANGLPEGCVRCCTMTSAANHQPVMVSIAQRVSQDDCIRFCASNNGDANKNKGNEDAAKKDAALAADQAAQFKDDLAKLSGDAGDATAQADDNGKADGSGNAAAGSGKQSSQSNSENGNKSGNKSGKGDKSGASAKAKAKRHARREMRRSRQQHTQ